MKYTETVDDFASRARGYVEELVLLRRDFHQHPELSHREVETSHKVAEHLKAIPELQVDTKVGGHGVVATLNPGGTPVIALRADMDALPIQETNEHDFISTNPGVMHACGHDAHTAMLLVTAKLLSHSFREEPFPGSVKFVFQPAEELADEHGKTGAQYQVEAGAYQGVDAALALHVNPRIPVGTILLKPGPVMASVDYLEAAIVGSGGHGGSPHNSVDPTWLLGMVLQGLHGIVSRRVSPLEPAAVSIGTINAGSMNSIIPSEVHLTGTVRSYSMDNRELMLKEVEKAFELCRPFGGEYRLQLTPGEPVTHNDYRVVEFISQAYQRLFPYFEAKAEAFGLEGEDFGHVTQEVPGAIFFLGAGLATATHSVRDLHTPNFDIDERCLPIGAALLAETARSMAFSWKSDDH